MNSIYSSDKTLSNNNHTDNIYLNIK